MRFSTHDRTPQPQDSKLTMIVFGIGVVLLYSIFILCAVLCFCYAHSVVGGLLALALPLAVAAIVYVTTRDMSRAYVEVTDKQIKAVDYIFGRARESVFRFDEIDHAEILSGHSVRVRGRRWGFMRYIVFRGEANRYLFKVIYIPETAHFFSMYTQK